MSAAPLAEDIAPVSPVEAGAAFEGLSGETALLVAVSGGPDSVALLALLAAWAQMPGRPALHAATVDHGLRPGSAEEAAAVAGLCAKLGVSHATLRWEGAKPASRVQAEARRARYALLANEARRLCSATLVTAHTLDDQAETMLMRLAHGSGPSGLAGMRERSEVDGIPLVRPLLGIPKERLVATAEARGLPFVRDPSNRDPRFERVRWREVMPVLAEQGLTAERLGRLAERMARLDEAAAHRASKIFVEAVLPNEAAGSRLRLDFSALVVEPEEIVLRVLGLALDAVRPEGEGYGRLERLEACGAVLIEAARAGSTARRTLSGCVLSLGRDGVLTLQAEPPRRRGVHPSAS
ncbi:MULTISPECIES: tRNA lysidine(34) synthetase TilS [Bosea]|uniref:tRNA lysidine(34) synthetase TilS n=1 Tax=Bosea TaxID=85413 RepID=UPI00214F8B93|nr:MULTISPECIES: tRNA lysidine(34) synthetase TilS [Bosea]MCR4519990.1 tRNA lysidine(34) synthetase TilS [Bosea sp. 47.2.35]MDR6828764.1 tRNA(Ile)-lysidine synthase [Bosea robiniae]MDR6895822.1 tRNA(Ile)-lysidine synthase [Bosea sp. BE109]MDR7139218.1 tRNA(Ile)-lysidine synthase [Bosea sp. BE168]MDR7175744.1 tRNA(Ile)-lysidine synthase [Bosea sp. BE271]